jgi:hypothetical protein
MLMDTEDDRETDEPAQHPDTLWWEDEGDCEPDIDDSYLGRSVGMYEGREGSCLHRIVRGRGVVQKVKAGEYKKVSVRFA